MPEVRLVGEDGKQIGVIKTSEALAYAQQRDLDLVEVAPDARPPVCRVLDYSKYKYEQAQKQKAARKHQQQITIREIKFRPKIAQNDYDTKKGHVTRFLLGKDKVKITIMFRGREVTHPERGVALLDKLAGELSELAVVEQSPIQDGRNMTMMLAPSKSVLATEEDHVEHKDGKKSRRERALADAEHTDDAEFGDEDTADLEPADDATAEVEPAAGTTAEPADTPPEPAVPADAQAAPSNGASAGPESEAGTNGVAAATAKEPQT